MARVMRLLGLFLVSQAIGAALILLGTQALPDAVGGGPGWMAFSLLAGNVFLGWALWKLRWVAWTDATGGRVSWRTYGAVLLLMVPAMFLVNLLAEWLSLTDVNGEMLRQLMHTPCGVLAISAGAPLVEEMLFRGGVQGYLQQRGWRPVSAICLAALLFGLVHGNPAQMPAAFLLGLLLGGVYAVTGSLWPAVAAHAFNNASGVVLELYFPNLSSFSSVFHSVGQVALAVVIACAGLAVGGYALWRYRRG